MDQDVTIPPPPQDLTAIFPKDKAVALATFTTPGMIQPWLDHVRHEIDGFEADVSTPRGRRDISSFAFKVKKSRTFLDGIGKELVDELKDVPKKIDATRKLVRDMLGAWEDEVRRPLTDWEREDEARIEAHKQAIAEITARTIFLDDHHAADLRALLEKTEADAIPSGDRGRWEEFAGEYQREIDGALLVLRTVIPLREQAEADRAELIQLRAAAAARDERDRFEANMLERQRIERARAEEAAAAAEADRIENEKRLAQREADRIEREARLVREAEERVTREAEEAKAREAAEALRRERDTAHRSAVHNDVRESLSMILAAVMGENIAKEAASVLLAEIAAGDVPHIHITY